MIKTTCMYCGDHLSGPPNADLTSHGICRTCHAALKRSLDGNVVEFRFYDPHDRRNQCVVNIDQVNWALIDTQDQLGRTSREVVE